MRISLEAPAPAPAAVDGVAVSTLSGNVPSGNSYTASLGSNVAIQVGAGSEIF